MRVCKARLAITQFSRPSARIHGKTQMRCVGVHGCCRASGASHHSATCGPPSFRHLRRRRHQTNAERAAGSGLFGILHLSSVGRPDVCHLPAVTSIRWELFRQGLEDAECEFRNQLSVVGAFELPRSLKHECAIV